MTSNVIEGEFRQVERQVIEVEVDRWNRYVLPHPETGEKVAWTRATTIAGTLADRFGLEQWDQRNIVWGLGQRPDLFARASAARLDDKSTLNEVIKEAKTMAGSKSGALLGSAIHEFTERIDQGEPLDIIPDMWRADVEAYIAALKAAGIVVMPGGIERVVCVPLEGLDGVGGIAGKMDRLVNGMWPLPRVGDVKTGANAIKYGMVEIPIQLAIYGHATHWWTGDGWEPMPKVDLERAVVFHMPPGQGRCDLYEIDIEAGWEKVRLAIDVRAWRKREGLAELIPIPHQFSGSVANTPTDLVGNEDGVPIGSLHEGWDRLQHRVEAIRAHPKARQWLAARWPVDIPTFPKGGPRTDNELTKIGEICERTERQFEIAVPTAAEGEDQGVKPSDDIGAGKGGEAGPPSADDPPAPSSPSANGEVNPIRFEWAQERVEAIKAAEGYLGDGTTPRQALAGLWSLRDEIPTFPKGGPRTDDELSAVIGMCDLVEMEFSMAFGPPDPTAPKQTKATRKAARNA